MKYWKVTYTHWFSPYKVVGYAQADSEKAVWQNFERINGFGYEDIDIVSVEETTAEQILSETVKKVVK